MIYNTISPNEKMFGDINELSQKYETLSSTINKTNENLARYKITNPIVKTVVGQNYIDIALPNTTNTSAPIAIISDVLSDSYAVTGVKLIDSNTCTWRFYFNAVFTTSVNFRMSIHYKQLL